MTNLDPCLALSTSPNGTHLGAGDEGFIQPIQGLGCGERALFCRGARRGFLVRERHRLLAAQHTGTIILKRINTVNLGWSA
jgi:hypothetical protein